MNKHWDALERLTRGREMTDETTARDRAIAQARFESLRDAEIEMRNAHGENWDVATFNERYEIPS